LSAGVLRALADNHRVSDAFKVSDHLFLILGKPPALRAFHLHPDAPLRHKQIGNAPHNTLGLEPLANAYRSVFAIRNGKDQHARKMMPKPVDKAALFLMFRREGIGRFLHSLFSLRPREPHRATSYNIAHRKDSCSSHMKSARMLSRSRLSAAA